jgi:hypothetical protein
MSRNVNGIVIIEVEPDNECELCGAFEETRPYGPGGKRICFDCGQKDKENTQKMMNKVLFGEKEPN